MARYQFQNPSQLGRPAVMPPYGMWNSRGLRGVSLSSGLGGQLSDVLIGTGIQTGTAVSGAAAGAAILGPGGMAAAGIGTAATAALATAGIAAAGMAIMFWLGHAKRNGMNKTNATAVADKAEGLLKQNLDAWNESSKTVEDRQVALGNAQAIIDYMVSDRGCGNPALDDPGRRCISERLTDGGVYPWKEWYVYPIRDYIPVVSNAAEIARESAAGMAPMVTRTTTVDPVTGQAQTVETVSASSVSASQGQTSGSGNGLILIGAGALIVFGLMGGGK